MAEGECVDCDSKLDSGFDSDGMPELDTIPACVGPGGKTRTLAEGEDVYYIHSFGSIMDFATECLPIRPMIARILRAFPVAYAEERVPKYETPGMFSNDESPDDIIASKPSTVDLGRAADVIAISLWKGGPSEELCGWESADLERGPAFFGIYLNVDGLFVEVLDRRFSDFDSVFPDGANEEMVATWSERVFVDAMTIATGYFALVFGAVHNATEISEFDPKRRLDILRDKLKPNPPASESLLLKRADLEAGIPSSANFTPISLNARKSTCRDLRLPLDVFERALGHHREGDSERMEQDLIAWARDTHGKPHVKVVLWQKDPKRSVRAHELGRKLVDWASGKRLFELLDFESADVS